MDITFILGLTLLVTSFGTSSGAKKLLQKKATVNKLTKLYKIFLEDSKKLDTRIVHGNQADKNEYPWQARLLVDGYFACGGVVLNERTILTAAHCRQFNCHESISDSNVHRYTIIVGTNTASPLDSSAQTASVEKAIVHRKYDALWPLFGNDIAILHLTSSLKFTSAVQPVRLSDSKFDEDALTNTQCYLSGWGRTLLKGPGLYELAEDLQETNTYIITNDKCRELYSSAQNVKITNGHVCVTYNGYSNSCRGDSGGPMGCYDNDGNFRLVGIVSFGRTMCGVDKGVQSGYIRVSNYRQWISEKALGQILL